MGGALTIEWIRPDVGFEPGAAASWRRAESDLGRWIQSNSSFRDPVLQLRMYNAWNAYAKGIGPYPGHSRAIHPDLSKHCQGLADDSPEWVNPDFVAFMEDRGWIRTAADDPTERHHFEYQWWRDNHRNRPTGANVVPVHIDPPTEEDEMLMLKIEVTLENTAQKVVHETSLAVGVFRHFISSDPRDKIMRIARAEDDWQTIDRSELDAFLKTYGCDTTCYKIDPATGALTVFAPLERIYRSGGMWSAVDARHIELLDAVTAGK